MLQVQDEYEGVKRFRLDTSTVVTGEVNGKAENEHAGSKSTTAKLIESLPEKSDRWACSSVLSG